jgi:hypothetical protein
MTEELPDSYWIAFLTPEQKLAILVDAQEVASDNKDS